MHLFIFTSGNNKTGVWMLGRLWTAAPWPLANILCGSCLAITPEGVSRAPPRANGGQIASQPAGLGGVGRALSLLSSSRGPGVGEGSSRPSHSQAADGRGGAIVSPSRPRAIATCLRRRREPRPVQRIVCPRLQVQTRTRSLEMGTSGCEVTIEKGELRAAIYQRRMQV